MIQNDYRLQYLEIMEYAKSLDRTKSDVYYENHHIIPGKLGGSNESYNMVLLTPEEHFKCHILLPYFTEGKDRDSMIYAWNMMSNFNGNRVDYIEYSELKEKYADTMSTRMSGSGNHMYGKNIFENFTDADWKQYRERQRISRETIYNNYSEEDFEKISENARKSIQKYWDGITDEALSKRKLACKKGWETPKEYKCPTCGRKSIARGFDKMHFDKCKKQKEENERKEKHKRI